MYGLETICRFISSLHIFKSLFFRFIALNLLNANDRIALTGYFRWSLPNTDYYWSKQYYYLSKQQTTFSIYVHYYLYKRKTSFPTYVYYYLSKQPTDLDYIVLLVQRTKCIVYSFTCQNNRLLICPTVLDVRT
jgi:hypothetical protein